MPLSHLCAPQFHSLYQKIYHSTIYLPQNLLSSRQNLIFLLWPSGYDFYCASQPPLCPSCSSSILKLTPPPTHAHFLRLSCLWAYQILFPLPRTSALELILAVTFKPRCLYCSLQEDFPEFLDPILKLGVFCPNSLSCICQVTITG